MARRIFLAGASGAVGRRLVPLLRQAGHSVAGTSRSPDKAETLRALGAEPVVVDVYDRTALAQAVLGFRPDIVVHQLTDLPPGMDPGGMDAALTRNARIRREGTRNLVEAALAAGVGRLVAQSIAWAYAAGHEPHREEDPLDGAAEGNRAVSVGGVIALEAQVLGTPSLRGTVLRYGQLYGPGTGNALPKGAAPVHVDAAAQAALLAITQDATGIFNIAEPNGSVATEKARAILGWQADFRLPGEER
jgi:nucleoside-diphosphate-sugar epimerase